MHAKKYAHSFFRNIYAICIYHKSITIPGMSTIKTTFEPLEPATFSALLVSRVPCSAGVIGRSLLRAVGSQAACPTRDDIVELKAIFYGEINYGLSVVMRTIDIQGKCINGPDTSHVYSIQCQIYWI
jgi:hypothetical protein